MPPVDPIISTSAREPETFAAIQATPLSPVRTGAQPIDAIEAGANYRKTDALAIARDRADGAGEIISDTAKGVAANHALPQRYELKAITPEPARGRTSNALILDTAKGKLDASSGKPHGDWVVRTDAPHGKYVKHHVNVNERITGLKDPHTPIPEAAYKAVGSAARILEGAEKVAAPIAIGVDAVRLGNAVAIDGGKVGTHTIHTAASVAGGWAGAATGALGGAEGGAAIGGGIGLLFGGIGAAPGAAIGGVAGGIGGGIVGAIGGSLAAEKAVDIVTKR